MSKKKPNNVQKIVSVFVLWCMTIGGLAGIFTANVGSGSVPQPTANLVPVVLNQYWEIRDWGVYDADYSITINSGGTLRIINSTLNFLQDDFTNYFIHVNVGGSLILENSTITTGATKQAMWNPVFEITVTDGTLKMTDHSVLAFPGDLTIDNSLTFINDSWITSLVPEKFTTQKDWCKAFPTFYGVVENWWSSTDRNLDETENDGPVLTFIDCNEVTIADSTIDELYEEPALTTPLTSVRLVPNALDPDEGTGGVLSLQGDDVSYYRLNSPNSISATFNTALSDAFYDITAAVLRVEYYNPAYLFDLGYDNSSFNSFNYSVPGVVADTWAFQILEDQTANDTLEKDIVANVSTFSQINQMFVNFTAHESGDDNPIYISFIALDLTLDPLPPPTYIILDDTDMTVINSYIGVDWNSLDTNYGIKNAFNLVNGANLYMYNMTMKEDDPANGVPDFTEIPDGAIAQNYVPFRVMDTSTAHYFKWLEVDVADRYDVPVPNALVNTTFKFNTASVVNQVSKINNLTDLTDTAWTNAKLRIRNYIVNKYSVLPANVARTGAYGKAMIPLLTTYYTQATYPNGDHVGEYSVNIRYSGSAGGSDSCDFAPMPNIGSGDNYERLDIPLADVELFRDFGSVGLIVNDANPVVKLDAGSSLTPLALNDFIVVEDAGTLTISNANMLMANSGTAPYMILVRENGALILDNVDLTSQGTMVLKITLEDNARLTMTDSSTTNYVDIMACDNAQVTFDTTELRGRFDTATGADVHVILNAINTTFYKSLDQFHGTSVANLTGCSSPLAQNFKILPTDTAKVSIHRWVEITVVDGTAAQTPLANANVWITTQFPEYATRLNRAGTTNANGLFRTSALSDYFIYDQSKLEVREIHYNLYNVVTQYQLFSGIIHNETTNITLKAYPLISSSDTITAKKVVLDRVLPDLDPPLTIWPIDTANSSVGRGTEVWVNTTVTNTGDAIANGVVVEFWDTMNQQSTLMRSFTNASMAPGASWKVSFPYAWTGTSQVGWHNVSVKVDPYNAITEQNEDNNRNYTLINITSQADLAILQYNDIWASRTYPLINETFDLNANVWNLGDLNATDVEVSFYQNGILLGTATLDEVPANPTTPTVASISYTFTQNRTYPIEVFIDPQNLIPEVDETNNNNSAWPMNLRIWEFPNLYIQSLQVMEGTNLVEIGIGGGTAITETYNRTAVTLRARIQNTGELFAGGVFVRFYDGPVTTANLIGTSQTIPSITTGNFAYATCQWTALTSRLEQVHTINAIAYANAGLVSNQASQTVTVYDNRADLELISFELANGATTITGNTAFRANVTITNNGLWTAERFFVDIYSSMNSWNSTKAAWNSGSRTPIGRLGNATITNLVMDETVTITLNCAGIDAGAYGLFIYIDTELNNTDTISYNDITPLIGNVEEYNERNNNLTIAVTVLMPPLAINLQLPAATYIGGEWANVFEEGETVSVLVTGFVVRQDNPSMGVSNVEITATIVGGDPVQITSGQGGFFSANLPVSAVGNYTVQVSGNGILPDTAWFRIAPADVFPWWILILIIVIVVAIIVVITLYLYFVGLGKTVQCGECGAFIPEGAAKCPKCGVEFETEVAKCSVCGAWVPIDVKNCPECKTEFTVGTENLDDYEAKMKRQYDDIVRKFRAQAKQELGNEFTETEFQAWWASKPTFITFDLWLKEEEEMKRMGSRPCPVCELENSVTAKICHKCGSVMGEAKPKQPKKPEGKQPPTAAQPRPQATAPAPAPQPAPQPTPQPAPHQTAAPQQQAAAPQPAAAQPAATAAPAPAKPVTPGKKGCPSCGMEVNVAEKVCPICSYDFSQPQEGGDQARRIIRKPIKKIVRRPGEPGGDQQQQQ